MRLFGIAMIAASSLSVVCAQPSGAEFELAVIRPSVCCGTDKTMLDNARLSMSNMPLSQLIATAWKVWPFQVIGPDWMKTATFDIQANLPKDAGRDQIPEMIRSLLSSRFRAEIHREEREGPVYVLSTGKSSPKMISSHVTSGDQPGAGGRVELSPAGAVGVNQIQGGFELISGTGHGTLKMSMAPDGALRLEGRQAGMSLIVTMLTGLGRPVLDKTGMDGSYDFAVEIPVKEPGEAGSDPGGGTTLRFIAALGLKLESQKAPAETIVVDHIEKLPTEN